MLTISGNPIFKIGMGTWGIGGSYNIGKQPAGIPEHRENPIEVVQFAIDKGINFFDTSVMYGKAEKMLGVAIKNKREKVFIATKCGLTQDGSRNYSRKYIMQSLNISLKNLQTDFVDLYQVTIAKNDIDNINNIIVILHDMIKKKLVRYIGLSLASLDQGLLALRFKQINAIQFVLNMIDTRMLRLIPLSSESNTFVIIKSPLNKGVLSNINKKMVFSKKDARSNFLTNKSILLRREAAKEILERADIVNKGLFECAAKFLFSIDGIGTILFGMRQRKHILQLLKIYTEDKFSDGQVSSLLEASKKCFPKIANTFE